MCPELCARKLVISPVTQTVPMCFSRRLRTSPVSSVTEKTRRISCTENKSSPKSHCDVLDLGIASPRIYANKRRAEIEKLHSILQIHRARMMRATGAAIHRATRFDAVPDDAAFAMRAARRKGVDRAFERI